MMICTTPPRTLALFLGVVAILVCEYPSFAALQAAQQPFKVNGLQTTAQQPITNSFSASELILSVVVNQMTLLRMLNESSTISSLRESYLENLMDLKLQLNATDEVLREFNDIKETEMQEFNARHSEAKEELRNLKEAELTEIEARNEEVKRRLQEVKEAALNELDNRMESALNRLHEKMAAALDEVNKTKEQSEAELLALKESAVNEVTTTKQQSKQALNIAKEAALTNLREAVMIRQVYRLYKDSIGKSAASLACQDMGGRLAVPKNEEEDDQLHLLVRSSDSKIKRFWIGIDDEQEEGKWVDSATGEPLKYINFDTADSQPDNFNNEDCAHISSSRPGWNDVDCDHRGGGYLCEFTNVYINE